MQIQINLIGRFVFLLYQINYVLAFTNGTLLPGYLCGKNDNLPKSLGGVLKFFKLPGADLTVANFHNQNSTIPQYNVISVTRLDNGTIMIPGELVDLVLSSSSGLPILGTLLYAEDFFGNRIGQFLEFGPNMQLFPPCNIKNDNPNVGIIHNAKLSETNIYQGIKWKVPDHMCGCDIVFKGVAVTDSGFGFHSTTFTLNLMATPSSSVAPVATPVVVVSSTVVASTVVASTVVIAPVATPFTTSLPLAIPLSLIPPNLE